MNAVKCVFKRIIYVIEQNAVPIKILIIKKLIKKYNPQNSFFYLDPPYYKIEYYRYNFKDSDFHELKNILGKIKGKYLMNINYNDFIINLFGQPDMKIEIKNSSVNNKYIKDSKRHELFYYN